MKMENCMVRANQAYTKVSLLFSLVWKSLMRACLHCRSYLWNWAILNGALWLKEAGEEVIKAETTDKLNSGIRCITGGEKYIFVILPSPLPKQVGSKSMFLYFLFLRTSVYLKSYFGLNGGEKKKERIPKHAVPSCNTDFPIQISKRGCYFGVCSLPPPLITSPCLSYWGIWSKDSQGAKYILIRTLEAAINEIQLSQTVAITGSDSFI